MSMAAEGALEQRTSATPNASLLQPGWSTDKERRNGRQGPRECKLAGHVARRLPISMIVVCVRRAILAQLRA